MKEILLTSSVLIGVVMVLRWLLRGKVRQKLLYAAWLLVALRLLVPVQFGQWSFSLNTLTETVTEHSPTIQQAQQVLTTPIAGPSKEEVRQQLTQQYQEQGLDLKAPEVQVQLEAQVEAKKTALTLSEILKIIWLSGTGIMALWFLLTNLIFLHRAKIHSQVLDTDAPVQVRVSDGVPTPCLVGLFRPVIYVTPDCTEDPQMLHHVLTHEIAHWRQLDPVWSLVRCVCLCIYWFNPLVWVAAAQSRRDCELSCDEAALKQLGDNERIAYGKTLLAMIRASSAPSELLKTATSMNESKKQLKERMCFIVKKPRNIVFAAIAMMLVIALAAGCAFTGGKEPEINQPVSTFPSQENPTTDPSTDTPPATQSQEDQEKLFPVTPVPEGLVPLIVRDGIFYTKDIKITENSLGFWKCPLGLRHSLRIPQLSLDTDNAKEFNRKIWRQYSAPLWLLTEDNEGADIYLCDYQWYNNNGFVGILVYQGQGTQMDWFNSLVKGYYYDMNQDRELTFEEYLQANGTAYDQVLETVLSSKEYQQVGPTDEIMQNCLIVGEQLIAVMRDYSRDPGWTVVQTAPYSTGLEPVQFPINSAFSETVFRNDTPQKELIGTWKAHIAEDIWGDQFSYTLELRKDGTAEYIWGIYGSDILERLEGTWEPGEDKGIYILKLTSTGNVRGKDPYDLTSIQQLRCSEDGTALQARWSGATQLFHFYKHYTMIMYRYDDDAMYYEIPVQ